jgi:hypothetical protein
MAHRYSGSEGIPVPFGRVFADQSVGVLVGAAPTGNGRPGCVHGHCGGHCRAPLRQQVIRQHSERQQPERGPGAVCWAWNRAQAGQPGRSQPPSGANGQRLAPVHARRKPGTNATGDQDTGRAARNRGAARQSLCGDKRNAQPGPPPLSPCECITSLIVTKIISRTSLRPRAVGHRMPRIVSEILERPGVTSTPSPSSGARGDRRP